MFPWARILLITVNIKKNSFFVASPSERSFSKLFNVRRKRMSERKKKKKKKTVIIPKKQTTQTLLLCDG